MQLFVSKWIKCIVGPSVEVAALLWNNLPEYNLQWMLFDYRNCNYSQFCNSINASKTTISVFERWMTISTYARRVNLFTGGKYRPKEFTNGREWLKPTRRTKMILVDVTKTRTTREKLSIFQSYVNKWYLNLKYIDFSLILNALYR